MDKSLILGACCAALLTGCPTTATKAPALGHDADQEIQKQAEESDKATDKSENQARDQQQQQHDEKQREDKHEKKAPPPPQ